MLFSKWFFLYQKRRLLDSSFYSYWSFICLFPFILNLFYLYRLGCGVCVFWGREKWFVGLFFSLHSAEMGLYVPVKVFSIKTGNKEVADLPGCFVSSGLSFCVSCGEDD